ncbi:VENN motif pre-toxin domain-containing protein [Cronobacter dublinensis]
MLSTSPSGSAVALAGNSTEAVVVAAKARQTMVVNNVLHVEKMTACIEV